MTKIIKSNKPNVSQETYSGVVDVPKTTLTLINKLFKIQEALSNKPEFQKEFVNAGGAGKYSYISKSIILQHLLPLLNENKVFYTETAILDTWEEKEVKFASGRHTFHVSGIMQYTFYDAENPTDKLEGYYRAAGSNNAGFDKAYGSAKTYGLRYALRDMFLIPDDKDDPDHLTDKAGGQTFKQPFKKTKLIEGVKEVKVF